MNVWPSIIAILTILLLGSPAPPNEISGQSPDSRNWNTLATAHVDLYYPEGLENMAIRAGEIAERSYVRIADYCGHEMTSIIPVIVYPAGDSPGRSWEAYPDGYFGPKKTSISVNFTGSYAELQQSITVAMTGAFISSMAGEKPWQCAGIRSALVPAWLTAGMALYLSRGFDSAAETEIRGIIRAGRFHGLRGLQEMRISNNAEFSSTGQAFCLFLEKRFGKDSPGELLRSFMDADSFDDAIISAMGKSVDELDREWASFLLERYRHDNASRESRKIMRMKGVPAGIMIPAVSPDGRKMAALRCRSGGEDLVLLDIAHGSSSLMIPVKNLFHGAGCGVKPVSHRDNRISWSRDGGIIVLAGNRKDRPCLVFIEASTGKVVFTRLFPFTMIKDPSLSPDGGYVAFSAVAGSAEDIYLYDRRIDTVARITDDDFSDRYPVLSADGQSVIFSTNSSPGGDPANGGYRLCQIDVKTGKRMELAPATGNAIQPDLSPDGRKLLFISDRSGLQRVYQYNIVMKSLSILPGIHGGASNPRWSGGSASYLYMQRDISTNDIITGTDEDSVAANPSLLEADVYPAAYREPYADPKGYVFNQYRSRVDTVWIRIGAAGTMNNSVLCFLQAGLSDRMNRHSLVLDAQYVHQHGNDINARLAYHLRIKRTALIFGIFQQGNPLALHYLEELTAHSPGQSFGIIGMEHYGGYMSVMFHLWKSISLSLSASSGRYEKHYSYPDTRSDLRMTFGKLTCMAEYNDQNWGLMVPVRGSLVRVIAEHAFDFTGKKSFTRLGIDLRHRFLFGRQAMLSLRGAGATLVGGNHGGFQYYLGGFDTLRGYGLNAIRGRNMFLFNAELGFSPAGWQAFGSPLMGGLGTIAFAIFFDAGSAWNGKYRLVDKKTGRLDDLKMDFGAGIRLAISPLLILKLDFAWPFDNKMIQQTRMLFGLGFDY